MHRQFSSQAANRVRPRPFVVIALLAMALGACAYRPVHETPIDEFVNRSNQLDAAGYSVQIGDVLTVKFYFNPELDFDVPVRADGKISLSLIGDVAAAGNTTQALSATITTAYRSHLNQPNATVILKSPSGHRVFVTGEVNLPGIFTLQGSETALSAVSLAGGLTDRASLHQVVLVRRLPDGSMPMVVVLDLKKALNGSDPRQDVRICLNDVLYVPRTGSAEANVVLKNIIWNKAPFYGTANASWNGTIK
jgi:protein involved in polysaccharide export with SLBB domain